MMQIAWFCCLIVIAWCTEPRLVKHHTLTELLQLSTSRQKTLPLVTVEKRRFEFDSVNTPSVVTANKITVMDGADLEAKKKELAFECLRAHIKWLLGVDHTPLAPCFGEGDGKFMKLPFKVWAASESKALDAIVEEWARKGETPPEDLLSSIGGRYMPECLKQRLLGPSQPDLGMPQIPSTRHSVSDTPEFEMHHCRTPEDQKDSAFTKRAFKGTLAFCVQRFLYPYLTSPCELM